MADAADDTSADRRPHGALPTIAVLSITTLLICSEQARSTVLWAIVEALVLGVSIPALCAAAYNLYHYVVLFVARPNTALTGWQTAAFGYGLLAALFTALAFPLLGRYFDGVDVVVHQPALTLLLPDLDGAGWPPASWEDALHLLALQPHTLGGQAWTLRGSGFTPGVLLLFAVTAIYSLQAVLNFVLTGCGAGPAMWRVTVEVEGEEMDELRENVSKACDSKYNFAMALHGAWRVRNPEAEEVWAEMQAARAAAGKQSTVTALYHGTSKDAARVITADGFRLPTHAGMFGKGVYFADCPLKSLQYTNKNVVDAMGTGRRYMLVCDVELGHTLTKKSAHSNLDPTRDLQPTAVSRALGQKSFDSVSAQPSWFGLRAPEYIVYKPEQALPRYILLVGQVGKTSPEALTADAEGRRREARRTNEAKASAAAAAVASQARARARATSAASAASTSASASDPTVAATSVPAVAPHGGAGKQTLSRALTVRTQTVEDEVEDEWLAEDGVLLDKWAGLWYHGRRFRLDLASACLVYREEVAAKPRKGASSSGGSGGSGGGGGGSSGAATEGAFRGALPLEAIVAVDSVGKDALRLGVAIQGMRQEPIDLRVPQPKPPRSGGSYAPVGVASSGSATARRDALRASLLRAQSRMPARLRADPSLTSRFWEDERLYRARAQLLSEAEQRRMRGDFAEEEARQAAEAAAVADAAAAAEAAAAATEATKQAMLQLFEKEAGTGAGETAHKILCCPLVVPLALAYVAVKLLVTRALPALLKLLGRAVRALCTGLVELIKALCRCLGMAVAGLLSCVRAVARCWASFTDWIARHFKRCLFEVHDNLVRPVDRCLRTVVWTRLVRCGRAVREEVLVPLAEAIGGAAKAAAGALGELLKALWRAVVTLDGLTTALLISAGKALSAAAARAAEELVRGLKATWRLIDGACAAFGRAVRAFCGWLDHAVLRPLGRLMVAIGDALGRAATWLFERVGRPLGRAAVAVGEWALESVLRPVGRAVAAVAEALFSALKAVVVVLWSAITALAKAAAAAAVATARAVAACAEAAWSAASSLFTAVATCLGPPLQAVGSAVGAVAVAIGTALTALIGAVVLAVTALVTSIGRLWDVVAARVAALLAACAGEPQPRSGGGASASDLV